MRVFGLDIQLARKSSGETIDSVLRRLISAGDDSFSGIKVTPENCMKSTTVNAVVTAVSRRIASLPIQVLKRTVETDESPRVRREILPSHPVMQLLASPNRWSDRTTFWLDATSWLMRYGNLYYFKSRGVTGPIRELVPLHPGGVEIEQNLETLDLKYRATVMNSAYRMFSPDQIVHARGAARDGVTGDSPIRDIAETIALEITAERMGGSVFGNAAMPSIVFKHSQLSRGFKTEEEERAFIEDFQAAYSGKGRFRSMVVPFGMELDTVAVDNEKAQFLATRQYQRTVIAAAFGVPPHLVGDLSRGTFNNVEQQSLDFVNQVVLPYARVLESAMERSLLTPADRARGVIIRFDIDAALRGDFKSRQEGLNIQRNAGIINANDWREHENMNPISDEDGGEEYWRKGPSGQTAEPPGGAQDTPPAQDTEADPSAGQESRDGNESAVS